MRGRILWAVLIATALVAGCSKKDSLYIEPGKAGPAQPPKPTPKPAPRKASNETPAAHSP